MEEDNLAALELEHHPLPLRRVNLTLLLNPKPHDRGQTLDFCWAQKEADARSEETDRGELVAVGVDREVVRAGDDLKAAVLDGGLVPASTRT